MSDWRDMLVDQTTSLVQTQDRAQGLKRVKALLVLIWRLLPLAERRAFIANLDVSGNIMPPPKPLSNNERRDRALVEALQYWPQVMSGLEGNDLKFAQSINKQRFRRNWQPSEKQADYILALYATSKDDVPDMELTE